MATKKKVTKKASKKKASKKKAVNKVAEEPKDISYKDSLKSEEMLKRRMRLFPHKYN
jgi:hypothetical protein